MANQSLTSVLSLGLSVAFILIIVALVSKDGELDDMHLVNTKALKTFCKPTEYKDACYEALAHVAKNTSATKKDYVYASFNSTVYQLKKAIKKAGTIREGLHGRTDDYAKRSCADLINCEKLLGFAMEDLQYIKKVSSEAKIGTLPVQVKPLLVWLTAARAYQTTCLDEIEDEKLKKTMKKKLKYATKHTYNAEKIIKSITKILKDFGMDYSDFVLPPKGTQRRLLDEGLEVDQDEEGFPSWVPDGDRRLLGEDSKDDDDKDDSKDPKDAKDPNDHIGGPAPNPQDFFKSPQPESLNENATPNAVVAKDGSGKYRTIKAALDAYPPNLKGRYIIYIKAGEYNEGQIIVNRNQHNVYMYGDGNDKTVITGKLNSGSDHVGTSNTATFVAEGERFMAKGIGFKNTIGPQGDQAVAFRSQSPNTVVADCCFEGYQNTLYYHTHDQFYKNCIISGTVDFIFGSGRAFFQDSNIYVRKPEKNQTNTITADGRMKYIEAGGVVLHNCKIMAGQGLKSTDDVKSYLGRPWKAEAKVMVMKTEIEDVIEPEGWVEMDSKYEKYNHETCMIREYDNKGPGSKTDKRVDWETFKVVKDEKVAAKFSADKFIDAGSWVPQTGVPVNLKL
ncbi:pectinesterase-like [Rutidosis leptorrhynchoides]|uniref:pectinesterase-like n=1 Tax=Rutidosis leptorrhynchoides TaxID=125765 RepID=UPI003A996B1E